VHAVDAAATVAAAVFQQLTQLIVCCAAPQLAAVAPATAQLLTAVALTTAKDANTADDATSV
jgi:hypothetical protein